MVETDERPIASSEVLVFRTPWGTRFASVIISASVGAIFFVLSFAAAVAVFFSLTWGWGMVSVLAVVPSIMVFGVLVYLTYKMVVSPLHFSVTLTEDSVTLGGGWLRRQIPYDDVELLSLPTGDGGHAVTLKAYGKSDYVNLRSTAEAKCAALLRASCVNAVVVDRSGQEYLPCDANRPLSALSVLYRRTHSVAWGATFASLGLLAQTCVLAPAVFGNVAWAQGILPWHDFVTTFHFFCVGGVTAFFTGWYALRKWRTVRLLKLKLTDPRLHGSSGIGGSNPWNNDSWQSINPSH